MAQLLELVLSKYRISVSLDESREIKTGGTCIDAPNVYFVHNAACKKGKN